MSRVLRAWTWLTVSAFLLTACGGAQRPSPAAGSGVTSGLRATAAVALASLGAATPSANGDFVTLPMLRGDIGNYLGLTNETVSRIFTTFKKRRLIEVRGRFGIRLINRRALKAIAERIPSERKSDGVESGLLSRLAIECC